MGAEALAVQPHVTEPAEAPRYSCTLGGALTTALSIYGTVPILHSGAGCGLGQQFGMTYAGGQNAAGGQGSTSTPCSSLVEEHVVFGGEDKLRKLVKSSLELMKGDFFPVISGCVPSLIGDDVDAVVGEFKDRAPMVHVKAPGFGGTSYEGYELFFEAVADQLLEPVPVQKRLVNVFGVVPFQHLFWKGDLAVLKRTLGRIGLDVNIVFTEFEGLANLKKIPAAELNLVLSPWNGHRVARKLEERFGTRFVTCPGVPVGPKQTTELLRLVAASLGVEPAVVNRVIRDEERYAYRFAEYFGDAHLLGLPHAFFAVVADSGTAIGLTKYLVNELAYLADIVVVTDDPPEARREAIVRHLTEGLDSATKPEVVFDVDAHRIRQKLKGRSFLFLLASSLEKHIAAEEYGAIHHTVSFPSLDRLILDRSYAGYRGGLALMEELTSKWVGPL